MPSAHQWINANGLNIELESESERGEMETHLIDKLNGIAPNGGQSMQCVRSETARLSKKVDDSKRKGMGNVYN